MVRRLFIFVLIVGILNAVLSVGLKNQKEISLYQILFKFSLPVLSLFIFFIIGTILITFLLRKFKPKLFSGTTITFTHWGMRKEGEVINYSMPWSKFSGFKETKHFLYLDFIYPETHIIQKRMFESETQLQMFKQFMSEKIGKK
jgi:hypothetical protein